MISSLLFSFKWLSLSLSLCFSPTVEEREPPTFNCQLFSKHEINVPQDSVVTWPFCFQMCFSTCNRLFVMSPGVDSGKLGEGLWLARGENGFGACFCSLLNTGKCRAFYFYFPEDNPLEKKNPQYWYWKEIWARDEQLFKNSISPNKKLKYFSFKWGRLLGFPVILFLI